tara:strand:+ start:494 stop:733 length:240 start_codon:yes stop_codon:yes gene_type:complete
MTSYSPGTGRIFRLLALASFAAGLAYLLIGEHRIHLLGWAPFLLLLLCPLLHMGMHGSHSATHGADHPGTRAHPPAPEA